jgi:hypothetical protein
LQLLEVPVTAMQVATYDPATIPLQLNCALLPDQPVNAHALARPFESALMQL